MRLWTIHPGYLDTKGLLALWREALLAQKVLKNETRGYKNHPQLRRFKSSADPVGALAEYLRTVYKESVNRGYNFSEEKISCARFDGHLLCTRGQLLYEWNHLKEKLKLRDARKYIEIKNIKEPDAHPLFRPVEGDVEDWEITKNLIR